MPVGKDQVAHLELSREIVRAFNNRYGDTFPEPQAVHTEAPIVLGTDGVRKMSKSLGNTIDIFAPEDVIRKQIMSMVTDTKRILRTDPGRPEVCNVCQLHRSFGDDYEEIWDGERTARTGCVDTKKLLAERVIAHYAEARERYRELMADPARIDRILAEGAERIRPIAQATMDEVRDEDGAALDRHARRVPARGPRPPTRQRDPRSSRTIVLTSSSRSASTADGDLLLRRHAADVLPGVAARLHHQPDRHAHRGGSSRACRASAATVLVYTAIVAAARLPHPRRRPGAVDLDHPVRRVDPAHPREHGRRSSRRCRRWLDSIGLTQVDLATQALAVLDNLDKIAGQLIVPLQSIAVASVGAIGTMLIVFILSIYMVIDRDAIMAFLFRLVPPSLRRGGAAARRRRSPARSAASSAARPSWASSTSRSRWSPTSCSGSR